MTLTACQKDEVSPSAGATSQTITVSIPQGVQTRAAAADFGDGSQIDRCLLQIYRNGQPYGEQQTATVTGNTATFNLRLVAQQKYDFVFWADCSEAGYETDDLSTIKLGSDADYTGNDDKFDAFFLCKKDYTVTESFSETFTLRRPFGQLNVKTLDLAAIPDNAADLKPAKVKVNFTSLPNTFNALTGEESGEAAVEYTADVLNATGELTVDYIWAPVEQATLADFTMTFLDAAGNEISANSDFKSIPIRRNYRTMVSGNLLTKQGDITVEIDPEFYKPDINDYPELRAALANGGSVTLSEDVTVEAPLVVETGKTVEIDLNGHTIMNETDVWAGNDWSLFSVRGGSLTVKNGTVKGKDNDCYACDVQYGGTLIIEDGIFVGNISAVYVHEGKAEIKGGTFSIVQLSDGGDPYRFLLNCYDSNRQAGKASIVVTGGTFENFNPADNAAEGAGTNFVTEGYTAIRTSAEPAPNGTYTVVKGTEVAASADLESALKSGDIAIVSSSMTIDDSPYISSVASATLSLKEGAVLTAQEGSALQQCINVSASCKEMLISGKGSIVGPKNSTATNVAGIYSGCPNLVIDGAITVDGGSGSKGTNAAIRVANGTTTIKDGYFTVGTDASGIANSCILVATARPTQKAHLKIYGGVFETQGNPINGWYPVINIQDADRKAGRATVEIYGGIFVNYNPATGDNTGEADDTFVAPGYKSVQTTYNGQQAWQVIPE